MTENDDWLDKLLRADRVTPVEDGGFADSVMARLPAQGSTTARWIVPVATSMWALLAAAVSAVTGWFRRCRV